MTNESDPYSPPDADLPAIAEQRRVQQGIQKIPDQEADELTKKFKKQNAISLGVGIIGILLQCTGNIALVGVGTLILIFAFAYYARMRGRSWLWGLMGLLSILGLIILYFLGKVCSWCDEKNSFRNDTCERCNAPLPP